MVALPQVYATADLPDTGGSMPLITPGQYPAVILKSELIETRDRTGKFLALTVVLTGGQFANTEFTERLNIINQNSKAMEIAYKTLARISEAVGMNQTPQDSQQLHNKAFIVDIGTEPGTEYVDAQGQKKMGKDKSIIKKFLPIPGGQGGFAAPQNNAFAGPSTAPMNAGPAVSTPNFGNNAASANNAPAANPFAPR